MAPGPALALFSSLRADLAPLELHALRREVREHYDLLLQRQRSSELVSVDLAEALCTRLEKLLEAAPSFTKTHRSAVVGAARYFVSTEDAVPDDRALTGLDDDVEVFNHTAREIGRPDLVIDE